ncbi:hypothetical protein A9K66_02890 [Mesorhizobium sp. AA23]|nr:hypothetical protein A9K66_02890 [Mesorhizobium sp. AA23]
MRPSGSEALKQHVERCNDLVVMLREVETVFPSSVAATVAIRWVAMTSLRPLNSKTGCSFRIGGGADARGKSGTTTRVLKLSSRSD